VTFNRAIGKTSSGFIQAERLWFRVKDGRECIEKLLAGSQSTRRRPDEKRTEVYSGIPLLPFSMMKPNFFTRSVDTNQIDEKTHHLRNTTDKIKRTRFDGLLMAFETTRPTWVSPPPLWQTIFLHEGAKGENLVRTCFPLHFAIGLQAPSKFTWSCASFGSRRPGGRTAGFDRTARAAAVRHVEALQKCHRLREDWGRRLDAKKNNTRVTHKPSSRAKRSFRTTLRAAIRKLHPCLRGRRGARWTGRRAQQHGSSTWSGSPMVQGKVDLEPTKSRAGGAGRHRGRRSITADGNRATDPRAGAYARFGRSGLGRLTSRALGRLIVFPVCLEHEALAAIGCGERLFGLIVQAAEQQAREVGRAVLGRGHHPRGMVRAAWCVLHDASGSRLENARRRCSSHAANVGRLLRSRGR